MTTYVQSQVEVVVRFDEGHGSLLLSVAELHQIFEGLEVNTVLAGILKAPS